MIQKVEDNFNLKPDEISADKVYGTIENRAYLMDNSIISNVAFYKPRDKEYVKFDLSKFEISQDLTQAICPNGCITNDFLSSRNGERLIIKFYKEDCMNCPLRQQCFSKTDLNKNTKRRRLEISKRYDIVVNDMTRNESEEFKKAYNKRYKVERRFATIVRNHGQRRCRYWKLEGAKIHITLANTACNIVRMVNLLKSKDQPSFALLC